MRTNVLAAAEQYPPRLPRIRKWITHVDEVLLDIYAVEADTNFTVLNDSNRVDFLSWSQLYRLMNQAGIDRQPLPELEEVLPSYTKGQPVPIVLLDMQYHRIRPDAVAQNLLRFSGIQLYDVAGRSESPYEALSLLAATPVALTLASTSPSFILRSEHVFGNREKAIKSITIDFGDGQGFREVTFNESIPVQYTGVGEKRMIIKVTYDDCSFAISHSAILIQDNGVATNGRTMGTQDFRGTPDEEFAIRATRPYEGGFATGQIAIEYGCGNDRLMKPLIIVEGFNPEQFETLGQDVTYDDFVDNIPFDLQNDLEDSGYDLVYLNYDDGGTYIQRNAYLLQALIQRVNAMKEANGSTEPNVVIGISMGGLVARYALADMERLGETHDTRLYISFDSPHQGANVPLGFQYAAYHIPQIRLLGTSAQKIYNTFLSNLDVPSPNIGVQLAETPAARQMLIQHAFLPFIAEHRAFMDEYQELGYPTQCRNVAIANGSQTGRGQGFEPGDNLLRLQSNSFRTNNRFVVPALFDWASQANQPFGIMGRYTLAGLATPLVYLLYGYAADIQVKAVANNSDRFRKVYQAFVAGQVLGIPITFTYYQVRVKNTPPLDSAPGGQIDYGDGLTNVIKSDVGQGQFCFIPTVSALDIRGTVPEELNLDVQRADIITNARTGFQDYDAPDAGFVEDGLNRFNEDHVTFSNFNARLFQQYLIGAERPVAFLRGASYNFGEVSTLSTTDRMSDMIISTGGQLFVNANIPIGPSADAGENPPPNPNSTFEVHVSPYDNCGLQDGEVEVRRGGEIVIGEDNPNNRGIMRFRQGSMLILESGSRLVIRNNSQLIIECGATLVFEKGATIETESDDARLTVDGNLQLVGTADFPYTYSTGNSSSPDVVNIIIEGPDLICSEGATFELSNLPDGTEVCWSVTSDLLFIEGDACANTVSVDAPLAVSGVATIQASIRYVGSCEGIAPSTITREVSFGPISSTDISILGVSNELCPNTYYTFRATPVVNGEYYWDATGLGTIVSTTGNSVYLLTNDDPSSGALAVEIDNGCGFSGSVDKTYSTCESISLSSYPVPSYDYMNLSIYTADGDTSEERTQEDYFDINLYDDHGQVVRQMKSKHKQVKMDVSGLSSKVYLVRVSYKNKTASKKVVIGKP